MSSDASRASFTSAANVAGEKVVNVAGDPANRASDRLSSFASSAGDLYASSADRVRDVMDELPASGSDFAAAGERLFLRSGQRVGHGVRKQPVEALLLAGAIGYLVGWAASRG